MKLGLLQQGVLKKMEGPFRCSFLLLIDLSVSNLFQTKAGGCHHTLHQVIPQVSDVSGKVLNHSVSLADSGY